MSDNENFQTPVGTNFMKDFLYSAGGYSSAKSVFVFSLKGDVDNPSAQYMFAGISAIADLYEPEDNSLDITNYKIKAKISQAAGNAITLNSDGLFVNQGSSGGLSAADLAEYVTNANLSAAIAQAQARSLSAADLADYVTNAALSSAIAEIPSYVLPTASTTQKGGVKKGNGLSIQDDTLFTSISMSALESIFTDFLVSSIPPTLTFGHIADDTTIRVKSEISYLGSTSSFISAFQKKGYTIAEEDIPFVDYIRIYYSGNRYIPITFTGTLKDVSFVVAGDNDTSFINYIQVTLESDSRIQLYLNNSHTDGFFYIRITVTLESNFEFYYYLIVEDYD